MTSPSDPTPTTEAGRQLLNAWKHDPKELWTVEQVTRDILAIEDEAEAQHEVTLKERGWLDEYEAETNSAMDHGNGIAEGLAQASAEALDVEVLARAIERACADHNQECWFRSSSRLGAEAILRAILAGETER